MPPSTTALQRNIPRFYLASGLYNLMLFMPIWVIFLQQKHGLSLTQVTLVDFAFWMTMALTEVPTGALADTVGRKASMLVGIGLSIISVLLYGLAPSFALLMAANSLWGIALTFMSGADMAFFYDTLQALGRGAEYPRRRGHLQAIMVIGSGLGNGLGGLLASWNITSPFVLYAGVLALALLVTLNLAEPPGEVDPLTQQRPAYLQVLRTALRAVAGSRQLRYLMVYSNLLPLANAAILITFIQPHALAIGVPLAAIGFLIFGLNLVRLLGSFASGKLPQLLGESRTLALAPVLIVLGVAGLGLLPGLAGVGAFSLAVFASVVVRPLVEELLLREVSSGVRATILSLDNLVFRLMLAGGEPLAGLAADRWGLPTAFLLMAGGVGLGLALLMLAWVRRRRAPAHAAG